MFIRFGCYGVFRAWSMWNKGTSPWTEGPFAWAQSRTIHTQKHASHHAWLCHPGSTSFWKHAGHELLDPKSDLALLRARFVGVW